MNWIKFEEQQPDPIDGYQYLVICIDGKEDLHTWDVQIWEWDGCYDGNCGWRADEEMEAELGGMPTHWAIIDIDVFLPEIRRNGTR
jgi:hypothetical protein